MHLSKKLPINLLGSIVIYKIDGNRINDATPKSKKKPIKSVLIISKNCQDASSKCQNRNTNLKTKEKVRNQRQNAITKL